MNKKEKLREKITTLQKELHSLEVRDWWLQRPHMLEFYCTSESESSDDGEFTDYFRPSNIKLNNDWIFSNLAKWETFCEANDVLVYPDYDDLVTDCDYYLRDIDHPDDYDYSYPNFVEYDEQTLRNPDYAS